MIEETLQQESTSKVLNDLELQRKDVAAAKTKSYLFIAGGILLFAIGVISGTLILPGAIAGGAVLIAGIVFYSKASAKFVAYRRYFKQMAVPIALKSVDESLTIDYRSGLSENEFIYAQLFANRPDRYSSEDQISGIVGKTSLSFSEVHAEYKTETRTKNGTQTHWHTILKGIVFQADFNKHFNGITVVRPKNMGAAFSAWVSRAMPMFSASSKELVQLENPEFNEEFVTYSTDQVEARYILTPGMMERLCELNKRCSYTISVSFIDSSVFIAFPLNKNYFEPPVHKTLLDSNLLQEDTEVIRFMYGIIKDLDLNTRIWTKD